MKFTERMYQSLKAAEAKHPRRAASIITRWENGSINTAEAVAELTLVGMEGKLNSRPRPKAQQRKDARRFYGMAYDTDEA